MKMKFRTRLRLVVLLALLLCALIGFAAGKFVQTITFEEKVVFTAELAEDFILRESQAIRQNDGSYQLSESKYIVNAAQEYILIPGLDVPKDPHVVITGKTEIPAYLFIEVVNEVGNGAVTFSLRSCWQETQLREAQHGGTVYVYCDDAGKPIEVTTDLEVYILENDKITVGQKLLHGDSSDLLTFYAYLVEIQ